MVFFLIINFRDPRICFAFSRSMTKFARINCPASNKCVSSVCVTAVARPIRYPGFTVVIDTDDLRPFSQALRHSRISNTYERASGRRYVDRSDSTLISIIIQSYLHKKISVDSRLSTRKCRWENIFRKILFKDLNTSCSVSSSPPSLLLS